MSENEQLSFSTGSETNDEPVVCLGLTFKNDDERRAYFREELRKKLPELKQIEGFPIGEDEDIIALSDPPYYTACPNPWINSFINEWELCKDANKNQLQYHREPFAADVSEGKTDPIYLAHSYHTKVPHKAIIRYLMHYTNPNDIILDGFSGTGMTGVAGALCSNDILLKEMGYDVDGTDKSKIGNRHVILNDLSPIATFISSNYNNPLDPKVFSKNAKLLLNKVKNECDWMFLTNHTIEGQIQKDSFGKEIQGIIQYTVYSDVFECPICHNDLIFSDVAVDKDSQSVLKEFACPQCNSLLTKGKLNRVFETSLDAENHSIVLAKQVPVLIHYSIGTEKFTKIPDKNDIELISKVNNMEIPYWFPKDLIPEGHNLNQPKNSHGLKKIHHFYSKRALHVLAKTYSLINEIKTEDRFYLQFAFQQAILGMSKIARYVPTHYSQVNQYLSGTLYIGSQIVDVSLEYILKNKLNRLEKLLEKEYTNFKSRNITSTQAIQSLNQIKDNSIDYVFTDPPFGANLMYSDLNFLWEAWGRLKTNIEKETIVNNFQKKDSFSYKTLMEEAFSVYYRVLKPNRWITVEFSNSKASIWNSIQDAIQKAGFIIANVSALDKKQGSFKAITSSTAVKQDLVISAYKPSNETIKKIEQSSNTIDSAWEFVASHLENLAVYTEQKGIANIIFERTPRILFDRMVAYHVQNNISVPLSSAEFQLGVTQRFPTRDGMAFLEHQIIEYDKKRVLAKDVTQMSLFVSDENSAIEWLRQQLITKPQTRQDIHTQFMKEIQHIAKHEKLPELDDLLAQNFLCYDNEPEVPSQIVSYFRRNYPDLRGLEPTDEKIKHKAMNRWYVPDPNKQADLEKLREKSLLREFNLYVDEMTKSKKKLKEFRTEAIRAGFKKAWSEKDYQTIVDVGNRLPEIVIQEDDKLLMYFDNAQIKLGL